MYVSNATSAYQAKNPTYNGRPDTDFAQALAKVSPEMQKKTRAKAEDLESVFLNTMFSEMTEGLKGEGPFGGTAGTGVWRSMLTDQYARSFAKAGGIGISNEVYRSLIIQQAKSANASQRTSS